MFCLNIALGNTSWRLLYREEEKARTDYMLASNFAPMECISLRDDFSLRVIDVHEDAVRFCNGFLS